MNTFLRCVIAACISVLALASPGLAQSSIAPPWDNPGEHRFQGTLEEACELHKDSLLREQCIRAMSRYEAGTCEVIYLQDGDILDVSFTSRGTHKKNTVTVAFGSQYGPEDPIRLAQACSTNRHDGLHMVRPQVCGNWSVMTLLPPTSTPPSTPVEVVSPPEQYIEVTVCEPDVVVQTGSAGVTWSTPGTLIQDCCCGQTQYIPGRSTTYQGTQGSYTVRGSCRVERRRIH